MPKINNKQRYAVLSRYQVISMGLTMLLEDDADDHFYYLTGGFKKKRRHAFWMSPFLRGRTDPSQRNTFAKLEADFLRLGCPSNFKKSTRMSPSLYMELLDLVRPFITYKDTNWRESVKPEERLSLTIRYLTRGDSVESLMQGYLVGDSTVLHVIQDTCRAIYRVLNEKYIKTPSTEAEWLAIAKDFHDRWNLPHCLGALDGKHVRITKPPKSGSLYYNYKKFYSIVLFALTDARYRFVYVDVGAEGKSSDSTLWKYSRFYQDLTDKSNPLNVPDPAPHPGFEEDLPYFMVGDDAFEMTTMLMKPFPSTKLTLQQRIYNYRISRGRRVVENSFGILATRFRILRKEIEMSPKHATEIVLAVVALHNYLRTEAPEHYMPRESCDWEGRDYSQHKGLWRAEPTMPSGPPTRSRNRSEVVKAMRESLARWFMQREGELPFQYEVVMQHDFYFAR